MTGIKSICGKLELERGGSKEVIIQRLMDFLMKPEVSTDAVKTSSKSSMLALNIHSFILHAS